VLVLAATALPLDSALRDFYASNARPLAHGRNVVNVILVDFRALDTLGEITVLGLAAIGVLALLKLRPPKEHG
jgi:multicomponent Na+:H+ antiporter subunit A